MRQRRSLSKVRWIAIIAVASVSVLLAGTAGANAAIATNKATLAYRTSANGEPKRLSSARIPANAQIHINGGRSLIQSVSYYLDDASASKAPVVTSTAPFLFAKRNATGGTTTTSSLKAGKHTLVAVIKTKAGSTARLTAAFTVTAPRSAAGSSGGSSNAGAGSTGVVKPTSTKKPPAPTTGKKICEKFGSTGVSNGQYMAQNNEWGAADGQCILAYDGGFKVVSGDHNKPGGVAAFPSIMWGCWMGTCTQGSTLPAKVSNLPKLTTTFMTTTNGKGKYNVAYDLWADPTPKKNDHNQFELMIWLKEVGGVGPIGSKTDSIKVAGANWDVWEGPGPQGKTISWVRQPYVDSVVDLPINPFIADATKRGLSGDWYLTNVQAGFEPWVGGIDATVNKFNVKSTGGTKVEPSGNAVQN